MYVALPTSRFRLYKEIPTLRECMLVEQDELLVETFRLSGSAWESRGCDKLEASTILESVNITIPLREIYRLVFTS
jgi:hypothetical protein